MGRSRFGVRGALRVMMALVLGACGPSQQQAASQATAASDGQAKVAAAAPSDGQAEVAAAAAQPKCKPGTAHIPGGTFTTGDDRNTEKAGQVTVAAFCMDTTEVTTAAYEACVTSGKCTPAKTGDSSFNAGTAGRENHPVNGVDWDQATAYCAAQGQRLPTEEEWEFAARGSDGRLYPWGNDAPGSQICWNGEGNELGKGNRQSTCAVDAHPKDSSPFGVGGMGGNVWEWTATAHDDAHRVIRGGAWLSVASLLFRSAHRSKASPSWQEGLLGFRCVGSTLP